MWNIFKVTYSLVVYGFGTSIKEYIIKQKGYLKYQSKIQISPISISKLITNTDLKSHQVLKKDIIIIVQSHIINFIKRKR